MPKYISSELSRLIKARSYAEGNLEVIRRDLVKVVPSMTSLLKAAETGLKEIKRLDKEIKVLAPDLDPSEIRPRRNIRRRTWKYGEFNNYLLWLMNERAGAEVFTTELLAATAREFSIPLTPSSNYQYHRKRVVRVLNEWVEKGFLERLHKPDGTQEGRWRLKLQVAVKPRQSPIVSEE